MAYAKLPKVVKDYGLGYQSVNQLQDNLQALQLLYQLDHGSNPLPSALDARALHSQLGITRWVGRIGGAFASGGLAVSSTIWAGNAPRHTEVVQFGGLSEDTVSGTTNFKFAFFVNLSVFWARAVPEGSSSDKRFMTCRSVYGPLPGTLWVSPWTLSGGSFNRETPYNFHVSIWGY